MTKFGTLCDDYCECRSKYVIRFSLGMRRWDIWYPYEDAPSEWAATQAEAMTRVQQLIEREHSV